MSYDYLAAEDPQIADAIGQELSRQRSTIELIASENIASLAVMQAMGTVLTNKYAEGYSGKRYYGGAKRSTSLKIWPSSAPASCSTASSPTCSLILALTPTLLPIRR